MTGNHVEHTVNLAQHTTGSAAQAVVDAATSLGYTVVAAGQGAYRLARTRRRMIFRTRTESATATVFQDRSGTRLRVVGTVDAELFEQLISASPTQAGLVVLGSASTVDPHDAGSTDKEPARSDPTSSRDVSTRTPPQRPPTATGLITGLPGIEPGAAPDEAPASLVAVSPAHSAPETATDGDSSRVGATPSAVGDRTVRQPPRRQPPFVTLPDGRTITLATPVVIGRDPDVTKGPDGSEAIAIDDRSMSKTHLMIMAHSDGFEVVDLHSTNGTAIRDGSGETACVAGSTHRVAGPAMIVAGSALIRCEGPR